ncbi:MAG: rpiA [Actinomycetia bacterium]|nr:rpiA [Actinomycetes bacterium]
MNSPHPALEFVRPGQILGLGTGRAAADFIRALGRQVAMGLDVCGVPTSKASAELAKSLGIPLVSLDDVDSVDVAFDGSDEVDPNLDMIKGRGGALVREKIVAAAAKKFIVLAGEEKMVATLGEKGALPVEVIPFALGFCRRKLEALGCKTEPRKTPDGSLYISDNGNPILDCHIAALSDPAGLERAILSLPGVVDTGLFLGMAHVVIVGDGATARILRRPGV